MIFILCPSAAARLAGRPREHALVVDVSPLYAALKPLSVAETARCRHSYKARIAKLRAAAIRAELAAETAEARAIGGSATEERAAALDALAAHHEAMAAEA